LDTLHDRGLQQIKKYIPGHVLVHNAFADTVCLCDRNAKMTVLT